MAAEKKTQFETSFRFIFLLYGKVRTGEWEGKEKKKHVWGLNKKERKIFLELEFKTYEYPTEEKRCLLESVFYKKDVFYLI